MYTTDDIIINLATADFYDALYRARTEGDEHISDAQAERILRPFLKAVLGQISVREFVDEAPTLSNWGGGLIDQLVQSLYYLIEEGSDLEDDDHIIKSMMKGVPTPYRYSD